jgi:hypothetical protein
MLIFRAALRYFSDSNRSEVDKSDIPEQQCMLVSITDAGQIGGHTIQRVSSPQQFLHIFRHDPRHVLQVVIQPVEVRTTCRIRCPCVSV